MQREIKFRAWDKIEKEMTEWEELKDNMDFGKLLYNEYDEYDDFEVMQYTGLKDKNGVEIYEGDIVSVKHPHVSNVYYTGSVTIDPSCGFFIRYTNGAVAFGLDEIQFKKYIEVVGNIYENPELLEVN